MVRSQNLPDLRSPKSRFRDIRFICTNALINSWKFYIANLKNVVTRQCLIFLRYDHLTWSGDLTWDDLGLKFSGRVRNWCIKGMQKKRLRCAPPFSRYLRKTRWVSQNAPPPTRAKVKGGQKGVPKPGEKAKNVKNCTWILRAVPTCPENSPNLPRNGASWDIKQDAWIEGSTKMLSILLSKYGNIVRNGLSSDSKRTMKSSITPELCDLKQ